MEYQNELIEKVKADIERLHQKYKARYGRSQASRLSKLRFFPCLSFFYFPSIFLPLFAEISPPFLGLLFGCDKLKSN